MASAATFPDGILAQHAYVTELVGTLREAQKSGALPADLMTRIEEVLDAVRMHFASEEEQMRRYGYPKLATHSQQHETFLRRLMVLRAECKGGDADLITMFAESLEHWLTAHEHTADHDVLAFLGLAPPRGDG
jgi:hemerythrin-like metal-binding protein